MKRGMGPVGNASNARPAGNVSKGMGHVGNAAMRAKGWDM